MSKGNDYFLNWCQVASRRIPRRQGGKEEAPQAYYEYVEEADDDANKGSRLKAVLAITL